MGIYTNYVGSGVSSRYTDVEPFVGENFNYHELGIIAASEIAANHNAFMKSIALSELAAVEQTGSTDVLYESVNIKGIFEKIKMFFKKIIEKIHKIFHTFVAKMSSWFGGNQSFAKNYEKEVIKGWANVKNDWDFKGYNFSKAIKTKATSGELKAAVKAGGGKIEDLLNGKLEDYVKAAAKIKNEKYNPQYKDGDDEDTKNPKNTYNITTSDETLAKFREKIDDIKDDLRKQIIDSVSGSTPSIPLTFDFNADASGGYDQKEFTDELFKAWRNGEDSKIDMNKDEIQKCYGGSISSMMSFIKDFDKTKSNLEACERAITKSIDSLINKMDKAENELLKEKDTDQKATNEPIVQASSLYQTLWGAVSEMMTQAFSSLLQANKEACTQAKEIAVKVIGQSKKMTESYDYSDDSYSNGGFDFISSVKLV